MKALVSIFRCYFRHDGLYLATHISFCALLSLIPLLLIVFSIVGFLLGSSQDVYSQLISAIANLIPKGKEILTYNLNEIVGGRHSFGIVGILFLIFFASLLFGAVERALNIVFEAEKRRNFFHSRFLAILLVGVISLFFFLPTAVDILTRSLARFGFQFPLGEFFRGYPFFLLFSFSAFVLVMVMIPSQLVRLRYAFLGGILFAIGLYLAKRVFRWYMLRAFDQYNVIYGSLTAFILLLLWIYYSSNILLLASEMVAHFQRRFSSRKLVSHGK